MNKPYLIQRIEARDPIAEQKEGIDKYFLMDYMGSSEFEWGALPKALKRLREKMGSYEIKKSKISSKFEKSVWVYSDPKDYDEIEDFLDSLSDSRDAQFVGRFKELPFFYDSMKPSQDGFKAEIVMWWDIENDFFFSKTKEPLNLLLKGLADKKS